MTESSQPAEVAAQPAGRTGLPPLPSLTDAEWRALPRAERIRLRELKRQHRASAVSAVPARPPRHPAGTRHQSEQTAFRDFHGRALHLDNLHFGASCFVVLSGPSSLQCDLSQLQSRGIWSLAVNNAGTLIRPNGWVFVDPPDKFHNAIWLD